MQLGLVAGVIAVVAALSAAAVRGEDPPLAERYLIEGRFGVGEAELTKHLAEHPDDDQTRLGLGILQFIDAVENLGQAMHHYGVRQDWQFVSIPFVRMPVPENIAPEQLSYPKAREVLERFVADLSAAEGTLAAIKNPHVRCPLRIGKTMLDLDGDGRATEPLMAILASYMDVSNVPDTAAETPIAFDRGDVDWLRGYCCLLAGMSELLLAYDGQELFDATAHLFFTNVKTPHEFLTERSEMMFDVGNRDLIDVIALVHLVRMPVYDADRMRAALGRFEKTLALSRESWRHIQAETDNEAEWIPNPQQRSAIGVRVTQEMIDTWLGVVEEGEALLAGKRLAPMWRGDKPRGVNIRRAFTEPRPFDLVLWIQGTAATPYIEEGPLTKPEVWRRLPAVFGGNLLGFATWFN